MSKTILCSTKLELTTLDRTGLVMNGINVTSSINSALESLLEKESNTLIISDKIIEEQSNVIDFSKYVETLLELHKPNIRFIYFKNGIESDTLTRLMYKYDNWDIHYNSTLRDKSTEEIIGIINGRMIPSLNNNLEDEGREDIRKRAEVFTKELFKAVKNNSDDIKNNEEFISLIVRNLHLVKDLIISHSNYKSEVKLLENSLKDINKILSKVSDLSNKKSDEISKLSQQFNELKEINFKLKGETYYLNNAYNKLVESVRGIINPQEIYTSLTDIINTNLLNTQTPLIIYIREIDQISYLTTYLKGISNIFNTTVGLTKLLVVENDLKTIKIPLYEEKGLVHVTDGTSLERVVLGNLITCGNNPKLMNYLLHNSLNLDYLIILDRTGNYLPLLDGNAVINFYACKESDDLNKLGIYSKNVISNNPKDNFYIPKIKDFKSIEGNYELEMSVVSSIEVTKKITAFIKEWKSEVKERTLLEGGAIYNEIE